ncbi:hypothetical protein CVT26_013523 [Gymnopilus dilepis]|uniref:Transmembrane protein n=1 Tax=Gymnopilus dilepis TaxID=231916 RepID=A0A409Y5M4_9AGAR|nr:hypothetical protein CVT26_013523 [Gymnopilus dilepis]
MSKFPRFFIYWLAIVTITTVSFLATASKLVVKPLDFEAPISSTTDLFIPDVSSSVFLAFHICFMFLIRQVSLLAEFISVDPIARTMTMDWYPTLQALNCSSSEPLIVDVYVPNVLLDTSSPSYNTTLLDQPTIRLNSTTLCISSIQYPSFRTISKLVALRGEFSLEDTARKSTLENYPFDVYLAEIAVYTRNLKTSAVMGPKVSGSFGVAVNFEITLSQEHLNQNTQAGNLLLYFRIGRSTATQAFVVIVAVTNWLAAVAFMTICVATLVYRPHKIYAEMFVVPVGSLFAFTSIRANLPGAPTGFGGYHLLDSAAINKSGQVQR